MSYKVIAVLFFGLGLIAGGAKAQSVSAAQKPAGTLTFRLSVNRIEPPRATVPEGRYHVRLINGIVRGEIGFELSDERSTRLAAKQIPKYRGSSSTLVDLAPGKYILRVPGREQWSCELTVTKGK